MPLSLSEYAKGMKEFSSDEMDACAKRGSCSQCGMCCVAFQNLVPIKIPEETGAPVSMIQKKIGEVCRHLTLQDGIAQCGAHHVKNHPTLVDCDQWKGNTLHGGPSYSLINNHERMLYVFWEWLIRNNELGIANTLIEKGLLGQFLMEDFTNDDFLTLIEGSLALDEMPNELLKIIDVKGILEKQDPEILKRLKAYIEEYVEGLPPEKRGKKDVFINTYFPKK